MVVCVYTIYMYAISGLYITLVSYVEFVFTDVSNVYVCFTIVGMAKTRSMTRNHKHDDDDDASIGKRIDTSVAPWSELNHDVLFLVMMELGVVDFVSFSGVCKSWRSLALPNKIRFMASKPPMELFWTSGGSNNTKEYSLLDFGGRKFKIILPGSGGKYFIGLTWIDLWLLGLVWDKVL